ncbi:hypothetical protein AAGG49_22250, partial [Stenotrophomonas maltophilia]|uniref:hypothetical protein n=1 Tax=Stenotrophomonas maltophilia TaxID=40324 RepID=UPI00313DA0CE
PYSLMIGNNTTNITAIGTALAATTTNSEGTPDNTQPVTATATASRQATHAPRTPRHCTTDMKQTT